MSQHTPTPWRSIQRQSLSLSGRDSNWREIAQELGQKLVVSSDWYERTKNGETETYCGVKISAEDAAFIVQACNHHAELVAALKQALIVMESVAKTHGYDTSVGAVPQTRALLSKIGATP